MGGVCLKKSGASTSKSLLYTFGRMAACGHTKKHLPHCEQRLASQTGTWSAIFLFSKRVVADG